MEDGKLSHRNVSIGSNVTFECPIDPSNISASVWFINGSNVNLVDVLKEYEIRESINVLKFIIRNARLWMNNTVYSCYDSYKKEEYGVGMIYVYFGKLPTISLCHQLISILHQFLITNQIIMYFNVGLSSTKRA